MHRRTNIGWKTIKKWLEQSFFQPYIKKSEPIDRNHNVTKSNVDFLTENDTNAGDLSIVCNDQDNELDNNQLTILDSNTTIREPASDKEFA